ncbi:LLM class flavin-dependent oxidoreductase [Mycobacterium sp. Aquia_216]|uniref:LLM class flavin-dependent oxidoreductase n=1 Tax=Mycobacterium sp. Aquia_216 TaxID=2991729 RepID=UPI00227BFCFE|nr:LLM class flavin-dependent oxidoreductase [Mycobacterium sp. Aquia_216]WAJ47191.1 LLM class flavin-dependent oxidoreductase [Mycobacterium sp. Aquia_216]
MSLSVGIEIPGDAIGESSPGPGIAGLARRLESAGVHYWVVGAGRGEPAAGGKTSLDPSLVATVAARHSTDLGLVVAASAHRDHPYNLARRLLSVDHASRGRLGWFALDADRRIELNASVDTWTGSVLGPTHTAEAIAAVRTLWRTWPYASVVGDRVTGLFADAAQIRHADVRGTYRITGPLNVPGSLQGDLPVWQQAGPATGEADLIVVEDGDPVPPGAVVRLRAVDRAALDRVSATATASGVLLRVTPDALAAVLDGVLVSARHRGVVSVPASGVLRQRLRLPASAGPDLSTHRRAFDAPYPGAR